MKREIYLNKISLEDAMEKYLGCFRDMIMDGEILKTVESLGRVTAEALYARRSAPHFYASAMDGIVVKTEDTAGANERQPIQLIEGKNALWIDTGDPIPDGYNAVIKIEEVNKKGDILEIEKGATPWQNIRGIGESVIKGQLVLPVNHKINPYDIGALLEAGIIELCVRKRPEVGIIPTGTELIPPYKNPEKGQLIEFNTSILKAFTEEWGGSAHITEIIPDIYEEIKRKLLVEIENNNITVIIAGSSAGKEDYTVKILQELGRVLVHGINIMPGKPVILALVNNKPVIGIPGYPLAAIFNFHFFVRSLIYQFSGLDIPEMPFLEAEIRRKVPSVVGLKELLRVNLASIDDNIVAIPGKRGSAAMTSLLNADGILAVPEQKEGLSPGTRMPVYIMKPESEIRRNLLLIGSHDLSLDVLANKLKEKRAGFELNTQAVGSMAGLMAIKRKETHLAGTHLFDEDTGEYNIPFLKRLLPGRDLALINLVYREQGLFIKPGNPKNIKGINDLCRDDIVFINRQRGAGTRVLLDYILKKEGIQAEDINGYEREEFTHIAAAAAVANGSADTALGIMAAARALDIDFLPLVQERYDLLIYQNMLEDERIKYLIDLICSMEFKSALKSLSGYNTEKSGEIIII
jgi:putative molybdopterin biosynthesis protein